MVMELIRVVDVGVRIAIHESGRRRWGRFCGPPGYVQVLTAFTATVVVTDTLAASACGGRCCAKELGEGGNGRRHRAAIGGGCVGGLLRSVRMWRGPKSKIESSVFGDERGPRAPFYSNLVIS